MVILVSLPVSGYPPSAPPKFGGDGSYGFQIFSTRPLHDTGKKIDLSVKSKSQTVEFWLKKDKFSVILEEGRRPLGSSNFAGEGSYGP